MSRAVTIIGPQDHGRRMSLDEFDQAEAREGYLYELGRGVVIVSDVPGKKHFAQVDAIKQQLYLYKAARPGVIRLIGGGAECKILVPPLDSERHPDVAVYCSEPPEGDDIWKLWVPIIVIEVVSPGSETRDYDEKPPEYLDFGVLEYWIFDQAKQQVLDKRRSGARWADRPLGPADVIKTNLLPGFELRIADVFEAARRA
jgi:Uma2 family endonuclease